MSQKPLIGISTCLLGENVRHDGGHKLDRYLRDTLGRYVEFVPVCPEADSGMSIPREAMCLVDIDGNVRLMTQKTCKDMTDKVTHWMGKKLIDLEQVPLCGFIFKSESPSSGLFGVKIYNGDDSTEKGKGIFARGFINAFPYLPVEEDGRLHDAKLRDNFIERIFVMYRWHLLNSKEKTINNLIDFHSRHRYTLMSHCPTTLKQLDDFIVNTKGIPIEEIYNDYFKEFITALRNIATVKKNTNTLEHIISYFKDDLTKDEKEELRNIISSYHNKLIPLIVPITLMNHYVRKYKPEYLEKQFYLNPHPLELMLRNHV